MSFKEMVDCTVHICMHISSLNYDHYTNKDARFPELEKMEMLQYVLLDTHTHKHSQSYVHTYLIDTHTYIIAKCTHMCSILHPACTK